MTRFEIFYRMVLLNQFDLRWDFTDSDIIPLRKFGIKTPDNFNIMSRDVSSSVLAFVTGCMGKYRLYSNCNENCSPTSIEDSLEHPVTMHFEIVVQLVMILLQIPVVIDHGKYYTTPVDNAIIIGSKFHMKKRIKFSTVTYRVGLKDLHYSNVKIQRISLSCFEELLLISTD